jgi:Flp pilus assembly secretin CpaC
MNLKDSYQKILCCVIVTICLCCASVRSQENRNQQDKGTNLGRDNPFAQLPRTEKLPPAQVAADPVVTTTEIPDLFVQTVMLKFLDAESLKLAIENMSSQYGRISTNKKNNSLIICDTKEHLERILSEIQKADKTPQQIMIEVVILDVQLDDDTELGINWDILSDKQYDIAYRQNFTASRLGSTIENATTIGNASAFNTTGLGGSFSVISGSIRNVIHLIQQKRQAEILASPRVMMVSGETASIEAVEELPYTEITDTAAGGAAALTSTRFKNVGVQLNVEATLTDSNDILLTVETEQNAAAGQSNTEVPIVDTRRASTSLLLKDGQVVVFGGLRRQEKTKETDQIPILGSLPIIGYLFKSTNNIIKNSELIIFLSPHLYKGEPVPKEAISKYKQLRDSSILKDNISKENNDRLMQSITDYDDEINKLQQEIKEREHTVEELKARNIQLEQQAGEHRDVNKQLQQNLNEYQQATQELKEYQQQLEAYILKQISANKQLQEQVNKDKDAENQLATERSRLEEQIKRHAVDLDQLQEEQARRKQSERDVTKKMLLDKIKMLQKNKDREATEELLSTLSLLDEILSQEMNETITSSEKVISDGKYAVDEKP